MYTLRIIEETRENENAPFSQIVRNHSLGNEYTTCSNKASTEFKQLTKECPVEILEYVRSVVLDYHGNKYFIYNDNKFIHACYYIMTENGKTFEKL